VFGIYALHRVIVPRHVEPDYDLYLRLWRVLERVQVIQLYGKALWTPDDFLVRHAYIRALNPKRLIPKVRVLHVC
jgi:hypothetical protein